MADAGSKVTGGLAGAEVSRDVNAVTAARVNARAAGAVVNRDAVDEHYRDVKPFRLLGLKLFLVILIVAALFSIPAAIRQKWLEWPPWPHLVIVPKRDLPAYHQIQAADLTAEVRLTKQPQAGMAMNAEDVVGRYTLEAASEGKPMVEVQLGPVVNAALFSGKTIVEVPVPTATVLIGRIKAGDIVDIVFESSPAQTQPQPQQTTSHEMTPGQIQQPSIPAQGQPSPNPSFQNILVLNGKPIEKPEPVAPGHPRKDYLLILALPTEQYSELMLEIAKKTPLTVYQKHLTN